MKTFALIPLSAVLVLALAACELDDKDKEGLEEGVLRAAGRDEERARNCPATSHARRASSTPGSRRTARRRSRPGTSHRRSGRRTTRTRKRSRARRATASRKKSRTRRTRKSTSPGAATQGRSNCCNRAKPGRPSRSRSAPPEDAPLPRGGRRCARRAVNRDRSTVRDASLTRCAALGCAAARRGAFSSSESTRHRVNAVTSVGISIDRSGTPFAITASQSLDVRVAGDYFFTIGAPLQDVAALPGSDSTPGLRARRSSGQGSTRGGGC